MKYRLLIALIAVAILVLAYQTQTPSSTQEVQVPATAMPSVMASLTATPMRTAPPTKRRSIPIPTDTTTSTRPPRTATPSPTATATPYKVWRVTDPLLSQPMGVAVDDGRGRLYVADHELGIVVFDLAGQKIDSYQPLRDFAPVDIQVAKNGDLYVANPADSTGNIAVLSADGKFMFNFGTNGGANGQFGPSSPNSIALDPQGDVWALDTRYRDDGTTAQHVLHHFSSKGVFQNALQLSALTHFQQGEIAISPNGSLYLTDFYNDSLWRLSDDGTFDQIAADMLAEHDPVAMAVDSSNQLFLTTWAPSGVIKLEAQLDTMGLLTTETFYAPSGIAVGADGMLYIVDHDFNHASLTALQLNR